MIVKNIIWTFFLKIMLMIGCFLSVFGSAIGFVMSALICISSSRKSTIVLDTRVSISGLQYYLYLTALYALLQDVQPQQQSRLPIVLPY